MNAPFKAIAASLALMAIATQAGDQVRGEPHRLRHASVDVRFVEPVILARAEDASLARSPSASRGDSATESPASDPADWTMLLAGLLGAGAIARRRLSF